VRVQGQEEQPRVLLLSVPYALKAADAQTLGGLPAAGKAGATSVPGSLRAATSALPPATSNVTTTGGTAQHLAMFTKATKIQNSIVLQMGTTAIDVVGNLGINNTTPSQSLDVKSGNAIVTGAGNFLKAGNTANSLLG
jgi:trimeric autotransporter adhesin